MKHNNISIQLSELETKALQLMSANNQLKIEREELIKENSELKKNNKLQAAEIKKIQNKANKIENNFQNSQKIAKIVKSIQADTKDSAELKEKLGEYIQEITKCISYLNQ